ncbi:MAG: sigma-70 family RNA polymerase sigma factor [Congregibacter sp.]
MTANTTASNDALVTLMARVSMGDRSAFKILYEETAPNIMGLLGSMLRQKDLAEDLLQDTFVKVWHRASDYHPERGQVTTWIASIARYAAIDTLRASKLRPSSDIPMETLSDSAAETLELLASQSDQERLYYCMDVLSAEQKQSISLAFFRGYTHDQLAEQLDTPLGTVKAWIRRGLLKLRECLER